MFYQAMFFRPGFVVFNEVVTIPATRRPRLYRHAQITSTASTVVYVICRMRRSLTQSAHFAKWMFDLPSGNQRKVFDVLGLAPF
jgi:hypothetical protein